MHNYWEYCVQNISKPMRDVSCNISRFSPFNQSCKSVNYRSSINSGCKATACTKCGYVRPRPGHRRVDIHLNLLYTAINYQAQAAPLSVWRRGRGTAAGVSLSMQIAANLVSVVCCPGEM